MAMHNPLIKKRKRMTSFYCAPEKQTRERNQLIIIGVILTIVSEVKKKMAVLLRVQYVNGGVICMPGASLNV
jgi:hypothetical protein